MKKSAVYIALIFALLILSLPTSVIAVTHEDNQTTSAIQNKTVYLDTGGKTGHLKYLEQYYIKNESGHLVIDQARIYYDGSINNSKMYFFLIRPLTKEGTLYPEDQIKAIAVLDNVTILNSWYSTQKAQPINTEQKLQYPEFFAGFIAIILIGIFLLIRRIIKRKKRPQETT